MFEIYFWIYEYFQEIISPFVSCVSDTSQCSLKTKSDTQKLTLSHDNVNGQWWKLQVGSKEQQTSHSQRFLILFILFFWMVHMRGRCYSHSPSLALTYSHIS